MPYTPNKKRGSLATTDYSLRIGSSIPETSKFVLQHHERFE